MTTEQFEQQFHAETSAVLVLNDTVAEFLLHRGHAAKIGEIATQVGKRIGASAKLIRQALSTNPQFDSLHKAGVSFFDIAANPPTPRRTTFVTGGGGGGGGGGPYPI